MCLTSNPFNIRFSSTSCTKLDTPEAHKSSFEYRKRSISEGYDVLKIRSNFCTMWGPKTYIWLPKILPKSNPRRFQEGNEIRIDARSHSEAFWGAKMWPCWAHVDGQDAIKFNKNWCPKRSRKKDRKMTKKPPTMELRQAPYNQPTELQTILELLNLWGPMGKWHVVHWFLSLIHIWRCRRRG